MKAPDQQLGELRTDGDIHAHACGEYVLSELQNGAKPADVVASLLQRYLVKTSSQRVLAYRRYREEMSDYMTEDKLARLHWESLYGFVSATTVLVPVNTHVTKRQEIRLRQVQQEFCDAVSLSTGVVSLQSLRGFFRRHEMFARLPLQYPQAMVYKDKLPWPLIEAYRAVLSAGGSLHPTASEYTRVGSTEAFLRHRRVAAEFGYVAQPRACADACAVVAYATLKCEELFQRQVFHHSHLKPVQREFPRKYPEVDFKFWVKYGSWSRCPQCGSMFFNDKYFSNDVYADLAAWFVSVFWFSASGVTCAVESVCN